MTNPTPTGPAAADAAVLTEAEIGALLGRLVEPPASPDLLHVLCDESATVIRALAAERERYREALEAVLTEDRKGMHGNCGQVAYAALSAPHAAPSEPEG